MTGGKRLTPPQSRKVNSLVKKECCKTCHLGDKRINGNFQLAFPTCPGFFSLIFCIAFSLTAFTRNNNRQPVFPAQLIAHVPYAVVAALIGIVLMVVNKINRTKNDMVVNMPLVYVGS